MLELKGVDVFYRDMQALWEVSFTVENGEIVALIGSNGAGKSTVMKTISGSQKSRKGIVIFNGRRLDQMPKHEIVVAGVSLVPEGRRLFPDMTVMENLEMGAYIERARQRKEESLQWIYEIFPVLHSRIGQLAGTLSGGEQQMLAIARGLMSLPELLLLDELSLGLAPIIVKNLYEVIRDINMSRGITVLLVEQNVRYALETANRGYIIENGRIIGEGKAMDLLHSEKVKEAYLAIG
ncbi:MAG: ABC transporter ATP-binding protein [Deltaproteobacteria bacterium]|nr:ABC transporter ATP-binding protein [Deltaproteobacteria bacterium]